jgi:pyruvate dehydrogenase E1 component alpha subunit
LAKGSDPYKMFAEILGKKSGYCGGKGGSLHLTDFDNDIIATSGVVCEALPIAVGAALANKHKKNKKIVFCFFGEGATTNGMFYESLNFASYLQLPILFVCENNGFAQSIPYGRVVGATNLINKASSFGIEAKSIDANDVVYVYEEARHVLHKMKERSSPYFLECNVKRIKGHTAYDGDGLRYREKTEIEAAKDDCPIKLFKRKYLNNEEEALRIEKNVTNGLQAALNKALEDVEPDIISAFKNLYYSEEQKRG